MNEEAATGDSPQKGVFSKRSKIQAEGFVLFFFVVGWLFFVSISLVWTSSIGWKIGGVLLIIFSLTVPLAYLLADIAALRNIAVDQCVRLEKDLGIDLSIEQVLKLQRMFNAGGVFQEFVAMIDTERLAQPKDNYFATSGGQTQEACRRFVAFLHNNPGEYRRTN